MSQWYYTSNRQQMGPVSLDELKQLGTAGILRPSDLVWEEGMPDWVKANSVRDLMPPASADGTSGRGDDGGDPDRPSRNRSDRDGNPDRPRRSRARDENDDDDRPRRRRDDDEDFDDRPRRRRKKQQGASPLVILLVLGIVGAVFLVGFVVLGIVVVARQNAAKLPIRPVPANLPRITPPPGSRIVANFNDRLTLTDPFDRVRPEGGARHKVFTHQMVAGKTYTIDMVSGFDAYLRLEGPNGQNLAEDDDSGGELNARITFRPTQSGLYRIIATSLGPGDLGEFQVAVSSN